MEQAHTDSRDVSRQGNDLLAGTRELLASDGREITLRLEVAPAIQIKASSDLWAFLSHQQPLDLVKARV